MRCFFEPEKRAVGICRNCGRALCHDCLVEVDSILSCKGPCEEGVKTIISINAYSKRATTVGFPNGGIVFIILGTLFSIFGAIAGVGNLYSGLFPLILGIAMLVIGFKTHRQYKKIYKPKE